MLFVSKVGFTSNVLWSPSVWQTCSYEDWSWGYCVLILFHDILKIFWYCCFCYIILRLLILCYNNCLMWPLLIIVSYTLLLLYVFCTNLKIAECLAYNFFLRIRVLLSRTWWSRALSEVFLLLNSITDKVKICWESVLILWPAFINGGH